VGIEPLVKERVFVKDAPTDAKVLVYRPEQGRTGKFTKVSRSSRSVRKARGKSSGSLWS